MRKMMSCLLRISNLRGVLRPGICVLTLLVLSLLGDRTAFSQEEEEGEDEVASEKPAAERPMTPEEVAAKAARRAKEAAELARIQAEAVAELLEGATELTAEQRANFEKWIPHTFKRLQKRAAVHIVALGDSVTRYMSYDEFRENSHYAYHGIFAAALADEFFYPGGVRDIVPAKPEWSKRNAVIGDEITLENLGMNGRLSLHALSRITADGLVNRPDLVMINFGINDGLLNVGLPTYVEALKQSVRYVRSTGADVILLGPTDAIREGTLSELALTRQYSGAMGELAAKLGVFYFDLSSVTMAAPGTRPGASAEEALASIVSEYNTRYFDHEPDTNDGLHPNPKTHEKMGAAIFKALRDGAEADPYRIGGYVTLGPDGTAVVEFKMKNMQEVGGKGRLLLMPVAGMEPATSALPFDLAAGKAEVFKVDYTALGGGAFTLPADAPRVFVPMIVTDENRSYSPVFSAAVTPIGVVWKTGSKDLSSSAFAVGCDLVATGQAGASGGYEATWNGQTTSGKFEVPAGGKEALALNFEVPGAGAKFSVRDPLVLTVNAGGKTFRFTRVLEASRNIGLGETVTMLNPAKYLKGEDAADGRVLFSADASVKSLVLNFDVDNIPLEGDEKLTPLILEFQLDARSYGKRRKFGYVDIVRVKFGVDGFAERMSELRPSVFGDFYNRTLDNDELTAGRSLLPNGRARYSVIIPRSYLYLHEYALGNGNSNLGINAELFFARTAEPTNPYPRDLNFTLVESGINKYSAESLTALELAEKSTGRWSIRLN